VNLRPGRLRALRGIEQELANCDPHLCALFFWFTQEAEGEKMPRTERIRTNPLRLLARLRRQPDRRRVTRTGVPGPG
jgi:hypothetical protein